MRGQSIEPASYSSVVCVLETFGSISMVVASSRMLQTAVRLASGSGEADFLAIAGHGGGISRNNCETQREVDGGLQTSTANKPRF